MGPQGLTWHLAADFLNVDSLAESQLEVFKFSTKKPAKKTIYTQTLCQNMQNIVKCIIFEALGLNVMP